MSAERRNETSKAGLDTDADEAGEDGVRQRMFKHSFVVRVAREDNGFTRVGATIVEPGLSIEARLQLEGGDPAVASTLPLHEDLMVRNETGGEEWRNEEKEQKSP